MTKATNTNEGNEDNAIEVEEQLANGAHVLRGERRMIDLPVECVDVGGGGVRSE